MIVETIIVSRCGEDWISCEPAGLPGVVGASRQAHGHDTVSADRFSHGRCPTGRWRGDPSRTQLAFHDRHDQSRRCEQLRSHPGQARPSARCDRQLQRLPYRARRRRLRRRGGGLDAYAAKDGRLDQAGADRVDANFELQLNARIYVDDLEVITSMIVLGEGIAWLPDFLVRDTVEAGKLVPVLSQWRPKKHQNWTYYFVYAGR